MESLTQGQAVLSNRNANVRLLNVAELQDFGQSLHQTLEQCGEPDLNQNICAIAWTFGGKVPLKLYRERHLDSGFSKGFLNALSSWFYLDQVQDLDISIATTLQTPQHEPYVTRSFADMLAAGYLDPLLGQAEEQLAVESERDHVTGGSQSESGGDAQPGPDATENSKGRNQSELVIDVAFVQV